MPSCAARIVTSVATQLACAARSSQPGEAPDPSPPTDAGMSVVIVSPPGPLTRTRRPDSTVAVAALSV